MAVTDDLLYVASASGCTGFDVKTGQKRLRFLPPNASPDDRGEWGYVASVGDVLLGSVTKPGATFRIQDIDTQVLMWRDNKPVVCSDILFAQNRHTSKTLWTYSPPQGVIINPTIAAGKGRVYCVESTNPETRKISNGRINLETLLGKGSAMVALDVSRGDLLWRKPVDFHQIQHIVFLSYAKETLVVTGTKNVDVQGEMRVRYDLYGFDAASGEELWRTTQKPAPDHILDGPHGEQVQHSAIVGETIYNTGFALHLRTGQPIDGWKWRKSDKCGVLSTSAFCGFSRFSNPRMFDLKTGDYTALTSVTRPGCWINVIPAGGLVLIPEASSGCTCYYSIQTSLALTPCDDCP
jgi:outer membrane protein assembly factor BamB